MKLNHIILLLSLSMSASGYSQTAGSTGTPGANGTGATTGSSASGTSGTGATTSSSTSGATGSRVLPQPGTLPQQQPGQNTLAPQQREGQPTQTRGNPQAPENNPSLNALGGNTNQIAGDTNQLLNSTNQLASGANQSAANTNLAPTSRLGFTNRILSSNTAGIMTNANPMLMQDQALSETDRRLLGQIRGSVFGPNQAAVPPAGAPIRFILKDGAVRLVGTVSTAEERQRIENLVQQVPGVVRVFDALQVSQPAAQPTAQ